MPFFKKFFTLGKDETYNRAIGYYNSCKYKEAIGEFDKIILRDRGKSRLHKGLAIFYKSQAHRNSGIVHIHEGRFDEAMQDFKKALEIIPDSTILHSYLGICHNNTGRFNDAISEFEKVISDKKDDIPSRIRLGLALRNQGLYDGSVDEFRAAVKIKPKHADLHYFLGLVLSNKDAYQEAIEEFEKALEINPDYVEALSKLGFLCILTGGFQKASQLFNKIIKLDSHNEIALATSELLENAEAEKDSLITLARGELFKTVSITLGHVPFISSALSGEDKGLYNTLVSVYSKILKNHPNYADIRFRLAQLYKNQGRYEEARQEFKKVLDINPYFEEAKRGLEELK